MELYGNCLMTYTRAERSATGPSDLLVATYQEGPSPAQDQILTHWGRRWARPGFRESGASWGQPGSRLLWRGRKKALLYLIQEDGKKSLVRDSQAMVAPRWDALHKKFYDLDHRFGLLMQSNLDGTQRFPLTDRPITGHSLTAPSRVNALGPLAQLELSADDGQLVGIDLKDGQVKSVDLATGQWRQVSDPAQERGRGGGAVSMVSSNSQTGSGRPTR